MTEDDQIRDLMRRLRVAEAERDRLEQQLQMVTMTKGAPHCGGCPECMGEEPDE